MDSPVTRNDVTHPPPTQPPDSQGWRPRGGSHEHVEEDRHGEEIRVAILTLGSWGQLEGGGQTWEATYATW